MAVTDAQFQAAFTLKVEFNTLADPDKIKVIDETGYAGLGIVAPDTIKGVFTSITDPTGTSLYSNTNFGSPDTQPIAGDDNLDDLSFPNDADGNKLEGTYTFNYKIQYFDNAGGGTTEHTYTKAVKFCDESPTVQIDHTVDCVCSKLTSADVTSISSDTTVDVRTHTVKSPTKADGSAAAADVVTAAASTTLTSIFSGTSASPATYTSIVDLQLTIDLGSNAFHIANVEGRQEVQVQCDESMCDIYCVIKTQYSRVKQYEGVNQQRFEDEQVKLARVIALMVLYRHARECGEYAQATTYYNEILTVTGSTAGCGCSSGDIQLVIPTCGAAGNTYNVVAGTGISVGSSTGGGTTTFTIALDAATIASLASITTTTVSSTTTSYITVTKVGDDYQVAWVGGTLSKLDFLITIDYSTPGSMSISKELQTLWGSRFQWSAAPVPTLDTVDSYVTTADFLATRAIYKLESFLASGAAAKKDKVFVQITPMFWNGSNDDVIKGKAQFIYEHVVKNEQDVVWIKLCGVNGMALLHQQMIDNGVDKITLHISIEEGTV